MIEYILTWVNINVVSGWTLNTHYVKIFKFESMHMWLSIDWLGWVFYIVSGWTHNFLSESESAGLLSIPSWYWSLNMHVEGQRVSESDCSVCDTGLELMGCLSFHEFCREPQKKSPRPLPCLSHVCLCWFSHHCHWLMWWCLL